MVGCVSHKLINISIFILMDTKEACDIIDVARFHSGFIAAIESQFAVTLRNLIRCFCIHMLHLNES